MITTLEMTGYRCFEQYRIEGLKRVNLLVGRNNSGKTAVLEAVQLLTEAEIPGVLAAICERRGELVRVSGLFVGRRYYPRNLGLPEIAHLFRGHGVKLGAELRIADGARSLALKIGNIELQEEQLFFRDPDSDEPPTRVATYAAQAHLGDAKEPAWTVLIDEAGALLEDLQRRRATGGDRSTWERVGVVSPSSFGPETLAALWNRTLRGKRERAIVDALRVMDERVSGIVFEAAGSHGLSDKSGILIDLGEERVPLASAGDGMFRLLQMALTLVEAPGSVVLFDEIDTGLHWSLLGESWRLVIETARDRNLQVFATTHSKDCIEGLAWMCQTHPQLAREVSLQTIDPRLEEAVAADSEEIVSMVHHGIEMRT